MQPPSPDTRPPGNADLLDAIRNGDVAALGLLLERHRPALRAAAVGLLRSGPHADDAVQETCLDPRHSHRHGAQPPL